MNSPLIIDCHGHYTTAPKALEEWRNKQIANFNTPEFGLKVSELNISDDELRESIESNQLRFMRERGSDLTIFSPRASFMAHHIGDFNTSATWSAICNDRKRLASGELGLDIYDMRENLQKAGLRWID